MGSTYEDDCEEGDDIILCDGCNAEAHLRCLNMTAVPSSEWHCAVCADRLTLREARGGQNQNGLSSIMKDIDTHRDRELEEELINRALDQKVDDAHGLTSFDYSDEKCSYCSLGELDVCSPFVVGQCRTEHEAHLSLCRPTLADNFYPDKTGTTVRFSIHGELMSLPTLGTPYFPLVESEHGQKLLQEASEESEGRRQAMIVHQTCALSIFQARMDRDRHALRRRRSLVAKRAISLAGINCRPLGADDSGREYWRFPTSDILFVRDGESEGVDGMRSRDVDKEAFRKLRAYERYEEEKEDDDDDDDDDDSDEDNENYSQNGVKKEENEEIYKDEINSNDNETSITAPDAIASKNNDSKIPSKSVKGWKFVRELVQIRKIYEFLGSSPGELELKQNLAHAFLSDRKIVENEVQVLENSCASDGGNNLNENVDNKDEINGSSELEKDKDIEKIDKTDKNEKEVRTSLEEDSLRTTSRKIPPPPPAVDNTPAALKLIVTSKNPDVQRKYLINQETVFEEVRTLQHCPYCVCHVVLYCMRCVSYRYPLPLAISPSLTRSLLSPSHPLYPLSHTLSLSLSLPL